MDSSHSLVTLVSVVTLLFAPGALSMSYQKLSNCTDECSVLGHTCTSCNEVVVRYNESRICENDSIPNGIPEITLDSGTCYQTGCTTGGCPVGEVEDPAHSPGEICFNPDITKCYSGFCRKETCCHDKATYTCCKLLPCTIIWSDCQVPKQLNLAVNTSTSITGLVKLPHNTSGAGTFPFYASPMAAPGVRCASLRVWGSCFCNDGELIPGCQVNDSSTWSALDGNGTESLPAGLSVTCMEVAPSPLHPPDPYSQPYTRSPARPPPAAMLPPQRGDSSGDHPGGVLSVKELTFIIISSSVGGLVLTGLLLWCGCLQVLKRRWRLVRLGASYEPVEAENGFLRAGRPSSEAGPSGRNFVQSAMSSLSIPWKKLNPDPTLRSFQQNSLNKRSSWRPFGTIKDALSSSFRSSAGGAHASDGQGPDHRRSGMIPSTSGDMASLLRATTGNGFGSLPSHDLALPALPDDIEDEVFTLDDLDSNHRDHYPSLPVSVRVSEVELPGLKNCSVTVNHASPVVVETRRPPVTLHGTITDPSEGRDVYVPQPRSQLVGDSSHGVVTGVSSVSSASSCKEGSHLSKGRLPLQQYVKISRDMSRNQGNSPQGGVQSDFKSGVALVTHSSRPESEGGGGSTALSGSRGRVDTDTALVASDGNFVLEEEDCVEEDGGEREGLVSAEFPGVGRSGTKFNSSKQLDL
ncbi:hypothetical protein CEUSTIGMA_g4272.t1 [Chlamydomonas eustigma]|uniref:Uncharacterized protein n=1 Tax=Chlamydomonas eustigma TaxID=1157962 RepID=A0A250X196_9CHLO|nr:hypothetical protein CEUSTIGMA_g4272.t1 [Chlamydomonas eustigma]|eukprot:GAX76826.1 hypothetical protein CEUSTIGMA_g4272.t1 [Chlamydomonas eustigma]